MSTPAAASSARLAEGTGTEVDDRPLHPPIGRATVLGFFNDAPPNDAPGNNEKSDQRREYAPVGRINLVADSKRTTNGERSGPTPLLDRRRLRPRRQRGQDPRLRRHRRDHLRQPGRVVAPTSRPGKARPRTSRDKGPYTQAEEATAGGRPPAIASARDPEQERRRLCGGPWAFAYKVGTIYIDPSGGTELICTGYAGVDVLRAEDQCMFGGTLKVLKLAASLACPACDRKSACMAPLSALAGRGTDQRRGPVRRPHLERPACSPSPPPRRRGLLRPEPPPAQSARERHGERAHRAVQGPAEHQQG